MFCLMTQHHPWIERISDRFFEVSFDAAFRSAVRRYLKRKRISARAFGVAVNDLTLVKRLAEGRPVKLDTADKGYEVMGEPPLRTLFLQEVEAYLEITGTKAYVLGLEAVGDRSFVTNLRGGLSPFLHNIDRVRRWMGAHSTVEERRAIGAATLHESWLRLGVGGHEGHGQNGNDAPAAGEVQGYLTTAQAAKYLCVHRKKLDRMRYEGGGPAYYKFGKSVRYRLEDLEAWARPRRRLSTSEADAAHTGAGQ